MKKFSEIYLNEVAMTGKATDGRPNVQKYVQDNPKALEIDWELEKDWENYKKGMNFRLNSKTIFEVDGKPALDTTLGKMPLKYARKPSGFKAMAAEMMATNELNDEIKKATSENNGPITIKIGKFTVKDVVAAGADHIKGDPKADIALIDANGKEVGFISHKKEGGAAAFQQYSGISKAAGMKHKEIDSFLTALNKDAGKIAPKGYAAYREVDSNVLINQSVYGPDYPGAFGRDNCHCIGQGTPILVKNGKVYELDFSENIHYNGDVKWAKKGKYLAVFGATMRSGRKITTKDGKTTKNLRAGIYPISVIKSRKALKEI
jgi:hypothetical protein